MKKVTFVCSGNTCRSPLAKALYEKYLADKKIDGIEVSSAGVSAFSGDSATEEAITVARERGVDLTSHRSRRLNFEDLNTTDLFICMADSHADAIRSLGKKKP